MLKWLCVLAAHILFCIIEFLVVLLARRSILQLTSAKLFRYTARRLCLCVLLGARPYNNSLSSFTTAAMPVAISAKMFYSLLTVIV